MPPKSIAELTSYILASLLAENPERIAAMNRTRKEVTQVSQCRYYVGDAARCASHLASNMCFYVSLKTALLQGFASLATLATQIVTLTVIGACG